MRRVLLPKIKILFSMGVFVLWGCVQTALAAQTAVIATAASDYSSGAHAIISVDKFNGHRAVAANLDPAGSDQKVIAFGAYFYRLERSSANSITKYDINAPSTPIWQFSTEGDETGSNPHDLVFVNAHKAYLIRYGSPKIWIVDPSVSADDGAGFKTGEIDLSAYSDGDGLPEAQAGVIVGSKLYIAMQRIDFTNGYGYYIYHTSYVAVFDTATNNEIDTGMGEGNLKGIAIPAIKNPVEISYVPPTGKLYVLCVGNWDAASTPSGGIVSIDPDTYVAKAVITDNSASYGAITGMAVLNGSKGYFIGEAGWRDDSLYAFNPSTGGDVNVTNIAHKGLAGMDDGLVVDANNMLWVCNQTDHSVDVLNTDTNTVDESVDTSLNPQNIAFAGEIDQCSLKGDINCNGRIGIEDAITILQMISGVR